MSDDNSISFPNPNPNGKKIPNKMIRSDIGICTKCFSKWTEKDGCLNPKCPEIVYRKLTNERD